MRADAVLYLGDTALDNAAAYLAGLMHHWGWPFDHVPSDNPAGPELFASKRSLYVVSDYPSQQLAGNLLKRLLDDVDSGAGLLMIGGWESYNGLGGDWDATALASALPVEIAGDDDRVNCDRPLLIRKVRNHESVDGLPWDERPPLIGGFNRVVPKADGNVILESEQIQVRRDGDRFEFAPGPREPLLVTGTFGSGRTAALTTDVAPHWVGPLVDWGGGRVTAKADGANQVEVGDLYAQFLFQLLNWTRGGRLH